MAPTAKSSAAATATCMSVVSNTRFKRMTNGSEPTRGKAAQPTVIGAARSGLVRTAGR
jgi:hypothetical protein